MSDLSERLRDELESEFLLEPLACARKTGSRDTTQKFLFALRDNSFIESVLDPREPGAVWIRVGPQNTLCFNASRLCLRVQILRQRIGGLDEKFGTWRNC